MIRQVHLHIDLDAFYAQVESCRLANWTVGSEINPHSEPLCVQQWQRLVAVNYAARALGIKRHMNISEATALATKANKTLKCVHVPVYRLGQGGDEAVQCLDRLLTGTPMPSESSVHEVPEQENENLLAQYLPDNMKPDNRKNKASLAVYRIASRRVMDIISHTLHNAADECQLSHRDLQLQRMSIDEAAVNASAWVHARCTRDSEYAYWFNSASLEDEEENRAWNRKRLEEAKSLAELLKKAVYDSCGYTCSVGVAHTSVLAKLGSGLNKPNALTLIPEDRVQSILENIPLQQLRALGGLAGSQLVERVRYVLGFDTEQQAAPVTCSMFLRAFDLAHWEDSLAVWTHRTVLGQDAQDLSEEMASTNAVTDEQELEDQETTSMTKSCLCAKSLQSPISDRRTICQWLTLLSMELFVRSRDAWRQFQQWPTKLVFAWKVHNSDAAATQRRTVSMPIRVPATRDWIVIGQIAAALWRILGESLIMGQSLTFISVTAHSFEAIDGRQRRLTDLWSKASSTTSATSTVTHSPIKSVVLSPKKPIVTHKRGPLDAFFKPVAKRSQTETCSQTETWKCPHCDLALPNDLVLQEPHLKQEHLDSHLARDLS